MTTPIRVTVTGAAGNIGYALLFRIANGDLFGPQPACDPANAGNHTGHEGAGRRRHGTGGLCLPAVGGHGSDR